MATSGVPSFFERQENAKAQSEKLFFVFIGCVVGVILGADLIYWAIEFFWIRKIPGEPAATFAAALKDLKFWNWSWERQKIYIFLTSLSGLIILFGASLRAFELKQGGKRIAEILGATKVLRGTQELSEIQLLNVVEEMALAAGMPIPQVFILNSEDAINAFAAGMDPDDFVICVSRGALDSLKRDELQALVAHETSHLFFGDTLINMRLSTWLHGIFQISNFGRFLMRLSVNSSSSGQIGRSRSRKAGVAPPILLAGVGFFIVGLLGLFFGSLLRAAISRHREHLADASAVRFTRNPAGLVGVLRKIQGQISERRFLSHPQADDFSHMMLTEARPNFFQIGNLFATHPPIEERIRLLGKVESYLEVPAKSQKEKHSPEQIGLSRSQRALIQNSNFVFAQNLVQEELNKFDLGKPQGWRTEEGAKDLLWALLVPSPRSQVEAFERAQKFLTQQNLNLREDIARKRHEMRSRGRILALRLALATLKETLTPSEKQLLLAHINGLFKLDGKITLRELLREWIVEKEIGVLELPKTPKPAFSRLDQSVRDYSSVLSMVSWNVAEWSFEGVPLPPPPPSKNDLKSVGIGNGEKSGSKNNDDPFGDTATLVGVLAQKKHEELNPLAQMSERKKELKAELAQKFFKDQLSWMLRESEKFSGLKDRIKLLDSKSCSSYPSLRECFLRLRERSTLEKQILLTSIRRTLFPVAPNAKGEFEGTLGPLHPQYEIRLELLWGLSAALNLPFQNPREKKALS